MSWSVAAMGKGEAVGRSLKQQFDGMHQMAEPEQAMKDKVAEIVGLATAGAPHQGMVVRAEGSQYSDINIHSSTYGQVRGLHLKVEIDLIAFAE